MINFKWIPSTLKQIAFLDAAINSLDIRRQKLSQGSEGEFSSIVAAVGRDEAEQKVLHLQSFLLYLASFQIGRPDVYISPQAFAASESAEPLSEQGGEK